MTKQLIKNTKKSDVLVAKATSTFDTAIQKMLKANELLSNQIDIQAKEIEDDKFEINKLQHGITLRKENIEEMSAKIDNNNLVIKNLSQFASSVG